MLQFDIQGKEVLDLFAGSGQMALEALSRGAAHAVLCDASRAAANVIRENATKTRLLPMCEIAALDWEILLRNLAHRKQFGLVFLDPPYALGVIPKVLEELLKRGLLEQDAKIVCETASEEDVFGENEALKEHFSVLRTARYGAAFVTVLSPMSKEE